MIAASKLNRAQIAALSSRPFVEEITFLTKRVAHKIDEDHKHKYMKGSQNPKTLVIVFAPDKGLCGALVTNIIRQVLSFESENKNLFFITVGKKAEQNLSSKNLIASFDSGTILPSFDQVFPLIKLIDQEYLGGNIGKVKVIYTDFKSIFSQIPRVVDLLPIKLEEELQKGEEESYLFEPEATKILPFLLRQYIEMNLYQFFLENYLSFQAAQMIAMQNATENAKELINALQLLYNKSRQERITNEILDISSGSVFAYE